MLHRNRELLATMGVCYPQVSGETADGQPALAWEILERLGRSTARIIDSSMSWKKALEIARESRAHTLLISAEDFTLPEFDEVAMAEVQSLVKPAGMTIIYGLRDPKQLIPSMWQQSVKWGLGRGEELLGLDEAVEQLSARYKASSLLYLKKTRNVAGVANIRPIIVPGHPSATLFRRFCLAACLPKLDFSDNDASSTNGRISFSQLQTLLAINRASPIQLQPLDKSAILAREFLLKRLERELEEAGLDPIPLSEDLLEACDDLRRFWTELVAGLDYIGDLTDLASTPTPNARASRSAGDPVQLLAGGMVELAQYAADIAEARDWWRDQAQSLSEARDWWQEQAQKLTEARDWWRNQAQKIASS